MSSWVVVHGLGDSLGVGDEAGKGLKDGPLQRDKRDSEVIEQTDLVTDWAQELSGMDKDGTLESLSLQS